MSKLLRQNVGGVDYTTAGCALTGVCASAASDFVKAVTLSDGDQLSDGMSVIVTFANGNTAGNAPVPIAIYSSDQTNYYSDSGMTVPFTLAPSGCYDLEYSGSGNAYSYVSYPVIQVGEISAPLCDSCGKKTSGAVWDAGDAVLMVYTGSIFMVISGLTSSVTAGSKKAITSGAVATELKGLKTFKIPVGTPVNMTLTNWGVYLLLGNIDGGGNFCFFMTIGNGNLYIYNLPWNHYAYQIAQISDNVITCGNVSANYYFTITVSGSVLTFNHYGHGNTHMTMLSANSAS